MMEQMNLNVSQRLRFIRCRKYSKKYPNSFKNKSRNYIGNLCNIQRTSKFCEINWSSPDFFYTSNINIESGKNFSNIQLKNAFPVCIIGKKIEKKLFTGESALGKKIKVKDVWLQVIGVIEEKLISESAQENLGIRDLNLDVYIPIKTFLVRFKDRKIISDKPIDFESGGMYIMGNNNGPKKEFLEETIIK